MWEGLVSRRAFNACAFNLGIGAITGELFHPALAFAASVDTSDIQIAGFPWKRGQILFGSEPGSEAGFGTIADRLQPNFSIGVNLEEGVDSHMVSEAMNLINELRPGLFIPQQDVRAAQVRIVASKYASKGNKYFDFVRAYPRYLSHFEYCSVYLLTQDLDLKTTFHALLHTLGIVDFIRGDNDHNHQMVNAQQYDLYGQPLDSVMSLAYLNDPTKLGLGQDDGKLIQLAGYL